MKEISIIIPVYNEEMILRKEITEIFNIIKSDYEDNNFEILIIENGSTDKTPIILEEIKKEFPQIKVINVPKPDYGQAIKEGIMEGSGKYSVIFNIDFWDMDFLKKASTFLENKSCDMVISSKLANGAQERRSFFRSFITLNWNLLLRRTLNFQGTDTHGMKIFNREKFLEVVNKCVTTRWLFDTELTLRAEKMGFIIKELPVSCYEKRKSPSGIIKRMPSVITDFVIMYIAIRKLKK